MELKGSALWASTHRMLPRVGLAQHTFLMGASGQQEVSVCGQVPAHAGS